MRILAFTDIHGSSVSIKMLKQKIKLKNPDLLICAGDISIFEHGIIGIMHKLNSLKRKIIIVHGNHEDEKNFEKISKRFNNIISIHKKSQVEGDNIFIGYGGDGFSYVDKEFERFSKFFSKEIRNNKGKKVIMLCHAPPFKTNLDKIAEGHCGNKSIRGFIEKNKVDLMICGHLHENFGKEDNIKNTRIINPGPSGKIINI